MPRDPERPDRSDYDQRVREEIEHYTRIFTADGVAGQRARETLFQPVPPSWVNMEVRAAALIRERTGNHLDGHIVSRLLAG